MDGGRMVRSHGLEFGSGDRPDVGHDLRRYCRLGRQGAQRVQALGNSDPEVLCTPTRALRKLGRWGKRHARREIGPSSNVHELGLQEGGDRRVQ